jgi:hypothetical protein
MDKEEIFEGVTEGFFETGTEGVIWMVYKDGFKGYDALEAIQNGDHLTIWEHGKEEPTFDGKVVCDYKTGWLEYPMNPGHGQPCALGLWVHWTQQGFEPDAWARLFFPLDSAKPNRVRLVRLRASDPESPKT